MRRTKKNERTGKEKMRNEIEGVTKEREQESEERE